MIVLIFLFSCTTTFNFPNYEWTNTSRTHERTHDLYPRTWLDLHDSRFVLPFESFHLSRYTTISSLSQPSTKKRPYMMIYVPLPPSPIETKKEKNSLPRLGLVSVSQFPQKSRKTLLLSSCWSDRPRSEDQKYGLWFMYIDLSPCSMYPM